MNSRFMNRPFRYKAGTRAVITLAAAVISLSAMWLVFDQPNGSHDSDSAEQQLSSYSAQFIQGISSHQQTDSTLKQMIETATSTPAGAATIAAATTTTSPTATVVPDIAPTSVPVSTSAKTPDPTITATTEPTATATAIPTATIVETPAPTATAIASPTPTADAIILTFLGSVEDDGTKRNGEVVQNENAHYYILTMPEIECDITVTLPSGKESTAKGTESQFSSSEGVVEWVWRINWNTTPGTAGIDTVCLADTELTRSDNFEIIEG